MRTPSYTTQFGRDVKRMQKRGKRMEKMKELIELLIEGKELPPKYRDHQLKSNWAGRRDAHIEPDWILIYAATDETVHFERTGTHSDLFKN